MIMWARAVVVGVVSLVLGCAGGPWRRERVAITPDELLAGAPLGVPSDLPALAAWEQVLEVNAEMEAFAAAHVDRTAGRARRLRQLTAALVDATTFGLEYDETTRTAAATFRARRGNCLSFSSMFVAMARHVGLDAHFQEVDTPPDWSQKDETFVLNRHVNVLVDLGPEGEQMVDFNLGDFRTSYDRRRIPDSRALAHHCNNLAVQRMQEGDTAAALSSFRRATEHDPGFSPAWTNLGTLYLRHGHVAHAEAAYLRGLTADQRDFVAMSSLARLYERQGNPARAGNYGRRVSSHRERNPYYRLQLARAAFLAADYDAAIRHLEYAIRSKNNEDQFYFLLGFSYLRKGDEQAARRWLARAEDVAATDALKHRYASKLDILLSASPDGARPDDDPPAPSSHHLRTPR